MPLTRTLCSCRVPARVAWGKQWGGIHPGIGTSKGRDKGAYESVSLKIVRSHTAYPLRIAILRSALVWCSPACNDQAMATLPPAHPRTKADVRADFDEGARSAAQDGP
jgi:hypothetical protein